MATLIREIISLPELEIAASAGTNRTYQMRLEDGTTVLATFQCIQWSQLNPRPYAPNNSQVHEAISRLATAKPY